MQNVKGGLRPHPFLNCRPQAPQPDERRISSAKQISHGGAIFHRAKHDLTVERQLDKSRFTTARQPESEGLYADHRKRILPPALRLQGLQAGPGRGHELPVPELARDPGLGGLDLLRHGAAPPLGEVPAAGPGAENTAPEALGPVPVRAAHIPQPCSLPPDRYCVPRLFLFFQ